MSKNVGTIYYEIEAKTESLLVADKQVDQVTDKMEQNFNKVDRSVSKLTRAFQAVGAALVARKVIAYAQSWGDLNNALINNIRSNEKLEDVTSRVFNIAQRSRSSLASTADLYSKLERATRGSGLTGRELAMITETINKSFVVSGATAGSAAAGIQQLAQALSSGKLSGDEFNSVMENAPRLAEGLAASLHVSTGELREMAGEGKITKSVIINAVKGMSAEVNREFSNMAMTTSQALEVAGNNATKYFGQNSVIQSGISAFNTTIVTLSEHLDELTTAILAMGAAYGGRVMSSIITATAQNIKLASANQQAAKAAAAQAAAESQAARANAAAATAALKAAMAKESQARASYAAAKGTSAEVTALNALRVAQAQTATAYGAMKTAAATANTAIIASGRAAKAASVGLRVLNGAMGVLGGPAGIAITAATMLIPFIAGLKSTEEKARDADGKLKDLAGTFRDMSVSQLLVELDTLTEGLKAVKENAEDAADEVARLAGSKKGLEAHFKYIEQTEGKEAADRERAKYAPIMANTEEKVNAKHNDAQKQVETMTAAQKELKDAIAYLKQHGNLKGFKAATLDGLVNGNGGNGGGTGGSGGSGDGGNGGSNGSRGRSLADMGVDVSDKYNRDVAAAKLLKDELDKLDAAYKAGKIKYKEYSDARIAANKSYHETLKQIAADEAQSRNDAKSFMQEINDKYLTTVNPATGQAEDPLAKLRTDEQRKIELLNQFRQMGAVSEQEYQNTLTNIQKTASMQREQIQQDEMRKQLQAQSELLSGASDMFGGLAGVVQAAGGEMSGAYKALFAISKGFAVAKAALDMQMAISDALGKGFPQNIPLMAQAASAGMQIASAIKGISYGGGRYNGGSVLGGNMYRVGEHGKPELFQQGGKNYMIPGDNGRVISNRDAFGGSQAPNMTYNITVNTTNGWDENDSRELEATIKRISLAQIREQATRPGGIIQRRK